MQALYITTIVLTIFHSFLCCKNGVTWTVLINTHGIKKTAVVLPSSYYFHMHPNQYNNGSKMHKTEVTKSNVLIRIVLC